MIVACLGLRMRFSGGAEFAPVAQWIEHLPSKQGVARSSRAGGNLHKILTPEGIPMTDELAGVPVLVIGAWSSVIL